MALHKLKKSKGVKAKRRVGRGNGSGKGTYSTRGVKGQKARTGGTRRPGFEGGQTPLLRKMPKLKGFKNPTKVRYQVLNVHQLEIFKTGTTVDKEALKKNNIIRSTEKPVKILSGGELTKKLTIVSIENVSVTAQKKIEKAGGTIEILGNPKKKRKEVVIKKKEEAKSKNKAKKTAKKATKK